MRHTNAQHRATGDPSEGHTIKTGEREVNLLGIANGDVEGAVGVCEGALFEIKLIIANLSGTFIIKASDDLVVLALAIKRALKLCQLVGLALFINCRRNCEIEGRNRGIAIRAFFSATV